MKRISILIIVKLYSIVLLAQTGEIKGKVTDNNGEPVPFAIIVVILDEAGKERTSKGTKANENGEYSLKGLKADKYNLMATSVGKRRAIKIKVEVETSTVNLDFKLTNNSIRDISATANKEGIIQNDFGAPLNIGGSREGQIVYFVDGIRTNCPGTCKICYPNKNILITKPVNNSVKIYPNPSNGIFNIQTTSKVRNLKIYDMQGNNIEIDKSNPNIIDFSQQNDGYYYLYFQLGTEWKKEKLELRK